MSKIGQKHGNGGQESECTEASWHYFSHLVKDKLALWGSALKCFSFPPYHGFQILHTLWVEGQNIKCCVGSIEERLHLFMISLCNFAKEVTLLLCVRKCPVRISDRKLVILPRVLRVVLQSLQANAGILPQIRPRPLPSTSFPIYYS
jgi:hypothetical protein